MFHYVNMPETGWQCERLLKTLTAKFKRVNFLQSSSSPSDLTSAHHMLSRKGNVSGFQEGQVFQFGGGGVLVTKC